MARLYEVNWRFCVLYRTGHQFKTQVEFCMMRVSHRFKNTGWCVGVTGSETALWYGRRCARLPPRIKIHLPYRVHAASYCCWSSQHIYTCSLRPTMARIRVNLLWVGLEISVVVSTKTVRISSKFQSIGTLLPDSVKLYDNRIVRSSYIWFLQNIFLYKVVNMLQ